MNCPLCNTYLNKNNIDIHFNCPNCGDFIMSHGFISLMGYIKIRNGIDSFQAVINSIKTIITKNQETIAFVEDYEKFQDYFPRVLELNDIAEPLGIDVIGNSCGSDYGD